MNSILWSISSFSNIWIICTIPLLTDRHVGILGWVGSGAVYDRSWLPESALLLSTKELLRAAHHLALRICQRRLAQYLNWCILLLYLRLMPLITVLLLWMLLKGSFLIIRSTIINDFYLFYLFIFVSVTLSDDLLIFILLVKAIVWINLLLISLLLLVTVCVVCVAMLSSLISPTTFVFLSVLVVIRWYRNVIWRIVSLRFLMRFGRSVLPGAIIGLLDVFPAGAAYICSERIWHPSSSMRRMKRWRLSRHRWWHLSIRIEALGLRTMRE